MRRRSRAQATALTLAMVFGLTACEGIVRVAPPGASMTLFTSATLLPVNGEAEITALLQRGEQGVSLNPNQPAPAPVPSGIVVNDDTVVQFSTTLGRMEPTEARTRDGQARVRLIGDGRSGTAIVTAVSGALVETIEIELGAAAASRIVLTANPVNLPAGGGTTTISARAEDEAGNGLLGVPVNFSSNAGTLSQTTVLTNALGVATTTLDTATSATVTGTIGTGASRTATVTITVAPGEGN